MNMFQGWKVKLYTFVTLLLFITGTTFALWPRNSVINEQQSASSNETIDSLPQSSSQSKQNVAVVPDSDISDVTEEEVTIESMSQPAVSHESDTAAETENIPEESEPPTSSTPEETNPPSTAKDPPKEPVAITKPPVVPPKTCSACSVVKRLDSLICPLTDKIDLQLNACKLEY